MKFSNKLNLVVRFDKLCGYGFYTIIDAVNQQGHQEYGCGREDHKRPLGDNAAFDKTDIERVFFQEEPVVIKDGVAEFCPNG